MLGGVVAAIAGPTLARWSREWIASAEFAGSYFSATVLYLGIFSVLTFLNIENEHFGKTRGSTEGRPLLDIARQPDYMVAVVCGMLGYAIMSFVMTATPLAMNHAMFMFDDTGPA